MVSRRLSCQSTGRFGTAAMVGFTGLAVCGIAVCLAAPLLDESGGLSGAARDDPAAVRQRRVALSLDASGLPATSAAEDARGAPKAGPDGEPSAERPDESAEDERVRRELERLNLAPGLRRSGSASSTRPGSGSRPARARSGRSGSAGRSGRSRKSATRRTEDTTAAALNGATGQALEDATSDRAEDDDEDAADDDSDEDDDSTPELGPTLPTPLVGKVMSGRTRRGVAGATVTALVFQPLAPVAGAPCWITPVSAVTDSQGLFSFTLEIPELQPVGSPVLGLLFSNGDEQLNGVPIDRLRPGQPDNLGIFWLRTRRAPLEARVSPAAVAATARVADTGGLNPLAWDARVRLFTLGLFPVVSVSDPAARPPIARQEAEFSSRRFLTLISEGRALATRPATWSEVERPKDDGTMTKESVARVDFQLGDAPLPISGTVTTASGRGLQGAVVEARTGPSAPGITAATDADGSFRFDNPPSPLTTFRVSHPEYITKDFAHSPDQVRPSLILDERRPSIAINLRDSVTNNPVPAVRAVLFGVTPDPKAAPPVLTLDLASATGDYTLTAPWTVGSIVFQREGYFEKSLATPDNNPESAIEVRMVEARLITLTARDAVARSDRWYDHEASSLRTYWQNEWLEFEADWGSEAAAFDLELGLRNYGLVDHAYAFKVRIELDGNEVDVLTVAASQSHTVTARLPLPPGQGLRRIRVTWLNDRYIPDQLDANIIVDHVKFHQRPVPENTQQGDGQAANGGSPSGGSGG